MIMFLLGFIVGAVVGMAFLVGMILYELEKS